MSVLLHFYCTFHSKEHITVCYSITGAFNSTTINNHKLEQILPNKYECASSSSSSSGFFFFLNQSVEKSVTEILSLFYFPGLCNRTSVKMCQVDLF